MHGNHAEMNRLNNEKNEQKFKLTFFFIEKIHGAVYVNILHLLQILSLNSTVKDKQVFFPLATTLINKI